MYREKSELPVLNTVLETKYIMEGRGMEGAQT